MLTFPLLGRLHVVPIIGVLLLSGCGTFSLAGKITPPTGKGQDQQQLDLLACKDQARLAANTAERQAGAFLLGLTIVGAPVAYELEKSKQREVFAACMSQRGYEVAPVGANEGLSSSQPNAASPGGVKGNEAVQVTAPPAYPQPAAQPKNEPAAAAALPVAASTTTVKDEAVQLQKIKDLRDKGLISDAEYTKKRQEILDRL
ncbi:MAG: SHOCT domain-containing protein [Zoogloea sp.]|jgi:hypothetical protein|nr:MAG: SHOCT domain-containing protein [Zoogloea sp.]HOY78804.1 SHOCT domain-containing protein [Hyphomonadaceae bacterium]